MNKTTLIGTVTNQTITTTRTSGVTDTIPLSHSPNPGHYKLTGQLHSYNTPDRHLRLYVQPDSITPTNEPSTNEITVTGFLCKSPTIRRTPNGRTITDLLIASPNEGGSDYFPCIAWGKEAKELAELKVADKLTIRGRIQSRTYYKEGETHTTYEVSVDTHSHIPHNEDEGRSIRSM